MRMCFDQSHSYFLSLLPPQPSTYFSFQLHVLFFENLLSPLSAACMCLGEGPSDIGWAASQEPQPWRKVTFPFPSSHQLPVVPREFV